MWLHTGATAGIAGLAYGLNGPVQWIHGRRVAQEVGRLEAALVEPGSG